MKKFLEFIWVLISPIVTYLAIGTFTVLAIIWVFTLFGLMLILGPTTFPSPLWVRWAVGIFDSLVLIMIVYEAIRNAYQKVYKN